MRNWGFYLTDAETWPTRKQDSERKAEERKANLCCHGNRKDQCGSCKVDHWKREEAARPASTKCQRCDDSGFVGMDHTGDWPTRYERCDCEAAKRISKEQLERTNKGLKRLMGGKNEQRSATAPSGKASPPERCSEQPEVPSEDDRVVDSAVCSKCGGLLIIRANGNHEYCLCEGKGTVPNGRSKRAEPPSKQVPERGGRTEGARPACLW